MPPHMHHISRPRVSTEIQEAIAQNQAAVQRAKSALEGEMERFTIVDQLLSAVDAAVMRHHPRGETLCEECATLHSLMRQYSEK